MRGSNQLNIDLGELDTALTRISNPLDKIHLKGDETSKPGGDAVRALYDAEQELESAKYGDREQKIQALKLADAKLEVAERVVNGLDESEIHNGRTTRFKQQLFESYGRNCRAGLPDSFSHLNHLPVEEIIPRLREEIQHELD